MTAFTLKTMRASMNGRPLAQPVRERIAALLQDLPTRERGIVFALGAWIASMLILAVAFFALGSDADAGLDAPLPQATSSSMQSPQQMVEDIGRRPVFSPSRRPVPSNPIAQPPQAYRDRSIRLGGVYIEGTSVKAFLVSADHPMGVWLMPGDTVGGWTIGTINATSVGLKADGESFMVAMPESGNGR